MRRLLIPIGSVLGILLCQLLIMARLPEEAGEIVIPPGGESDALNIVIFPYLSVAACLVIVWILIAVTKMPKVAEHDHHPHVKDSIGRLIRNANYRFAVIAQFFYVGAQIAVWTYTNFYIPKHLHVSPQITLWYHTVALILFGASRWVFTGLMKRFKASTLLLAASVGAGLCTLSVVFIGGRIGVYSLIGISVFMSLMFPTIFGVGSQGLGEDTKLGASGLIMAILGGALITPAQGLLIDKLGVDLSYLLPLICFIIIGLYGSFSRNVEAVLSVRES